MRLDARQQVLAAVADRADRPDAGHVNAGILASRLDLSRRAAGVQLSRLAREGYLTPTGTGQPPTYRLGAALERLRVCRYCGRVFVPEGAERYCGPTEAFWAAVGI